MEKVVIELTPAERDFLLDVFEAGFAALGISSLVSKLNASKAPAPAPAAAPAA